VFRQERIELSRVYSIQSSRERTELMATKLTPTEARQGTGPRAMFWVLSASVGLAVIAGLLLALGWISLPWAS
jgi:hypothetical protein